MKTKTKFLVIAVIALVLCVIMPVQAYNCSGTDVYPFIYLGNVAPGSSMSLPTSTTVCNYYGLTNGSYQYAAVANWWWGTAKGDADNCPHDDYTEDFHSDPTLNRSSPTYTVPSGHDAYNLAFLFYCQGTSYQKYYAWYNISPVAAPTPTPTPSVTPTPLPGYVRSTFVTIDATTLYTIHGSDISLYDTYAGTWTNSTSDADGSLSIDTLPYTVVNAYATYTVFANEYADASLMGVNVGNAGIDNQIRMYPVGEEPPTGYVNLFVTTMDTDGDIVRDATVNAIWDGVQHVSTSGTYGTAQYIVPNVTQVRIEASKTGYTGATGTINSGEGPNYAWTLYLDEMFVTPTSTITPGGTTQVTPTRTYGEGYTTAQGQDMMNWLAANGMSLVQLCFFVTILALLGVKLGK